jgi:hypothetical protein
MTTTVTKPAKPISKEEIFAFIDAYFSEGQADIQFEITADDVRKHITDDLKRRDDEIKKLRDSLIDVGLAATRAVTAAKAAVDLAARKSGGTVKIVIENQQTGKTHQVSGLTHKQFASALKFVTARNASGYPLPVWFYGNAGGGKSHMFRQIAQALGFGSYVIRGLGPTDTLSSIVGFKNHLTGEFVPGLITPEIYGKGGFVAFDEVANADPSVPIGLNDLVAGIDYRFPNGELVKKSKDFYLVASDNTNGLGSRAGFVRNKLDISSLTRFAFFRLDYDDHLEIALAGDATWAAYVQKVRAFVGKSTMTAPVFITPRASINGAALLRAGLPIADVCDAVLFTHCGPDVKATIIANCGKYVA